MIKKELYGIHPDGIPVHLFRIQNKWGEYVELLDYGASIHRIVIRDRSGQLSDVVLGAANAKDLGQFTLEGVSIGRCANRIRDAKCTLDGTTVYLEKGRDGHCLHSGSANYGRQHFEAGIIDDSNVQFYICDKGKCGFNCDAHTWIAFGFDEMHCLRITYDITPSATTVLSPTNHAFFNLGCSDARDHLLKLCAEQYAPKGSDGIPDGDIRSVSETPLDFRSARTLREALDTAENGFFLNDHHSYDDNLILSGSGYRYVGALYSSETGRKMDVFTDMPSIVLFTFDSDRPINGKDGAVYSGFKSVSLETQFVTNAVNCSQYQSPVFHKGESLHSKTEYRFLIDSI